MITMSQKEAARLLVLEQVRQGALSQSAAAAVLQLSTCQPVIVNLSVAFSE